ncbi:hypothetical protein ACB092_11G267500 [Castanea dentata]
MAETRSTIAATQEALASLRTAYDHHGGLPQSPTNGESRYANSSTAALSRPMRLEFPRFFGEDPASWVYKANQYFKYYNTLVAKKLMLASFHMEGEALIWFQDSEEVALHIRFGVSAYDDPMETLTRLRQTASGPLYKAQFEVLSNRMKGLSAAHKLSCFLSGLRDEVRLPVRMLNPKSLNEAFGDQGKPSILGAPPKPPPLLESKARLPIKRISPAQMEERRKKGLCYNCDEKWASSHKCKNAMLFLLDYVELAQENTNSGVHITELEENGYADQIGQVRHDQEDLEITLYALSGIPTSGTMRVMGKINQRSFVILIDSGSTHNFIDAALVSQLHIHVDTSQILEVKVANGDLIKTQGVCKEVPILIQGNEFLVHLHMLPMGVVT